MQWLVDFLTSFTGWKAYALVFLVLLACGFGVPIPEDITLAAGGLLSYYGSANVYKMILVGMAGVLIGDGTVFFLGKKYGRSLIRHRLFSKVLNEKRLEEASKRFNEKGTKLIFAARFMPGLRTPIFFSAGTLKVPFRVFLFYDGLAALLSVPAIVYAVYYFGEEFDTVVRWIKKIEMGILAVILTVIAIVVYRYLKKRKLKKIQKAAERPDL